MEALYIAAKIIISLGLVSVAVLLLILAIRSKTILKSLELIEGGVHGASTAILTRASILAMVLPMILRNKSKSNIWSTVFKLSPWAKDKRIEKLLGPITNITESLLDLVKSR